jgi:cytosine/adenosine deaminase-related metal-dependent hydrolase
METTNDRPGRPLVLRGGTVLTMDRQASIVAADVWVQGGRILAVGSAPPEATGPAEVLDVSGCVVMPGLIQGHIHLGQTLFRGLAEGRRLLAWLRERIWPLESGHDDESAHASALLGAAELLLGGTTTIQDIGIGPGARGLMEGVVESRLRALVGKCLMDSGEGLPGALKEDPDATLAESVALGEAFDGANGGRVRYLLNPRFILSCSDTLWRGVRETAERHRWPVHTHALEQEEETAAVRQLKAGRDEMEYFDGEGILAADLRIAHGVWLSDAHLERARGHRFSVVHCPSSNLKLGSGIADIVRIRRAGVPVGIGADGSPCNNDLDGLEELRLAALLQQVKHGPGVFSGLDALRLATSEGAAALGLQDEIGSVEVGKRADLLVLSLDRPELWLPGASSSGGRPYGLDLHDTIAYGASRAAVRHVLVEGEVLVREGRLTHLDVEALGLAADAALASVVQRSGLDL